MKRKSVPHDHQHAPSRKINMNKVKHFRDQKQAIYLFFCNNHSTMYDASESTGVTRPNVTRYVRMLEDDGLIERTYKGICPISKEPGVWYFKKKGE